MISLKHEQLAQITGGSAVSSSAKLSFVGVEYDSRLIKGGELFVALKGESAHGHQFLKQAFERGAALFLVEDKSLLESFPEPERLVVVSDTLRAFWALASYWRRELAVPVVAITGSVGKTTVKEMTAAILLRHSLGAYSQKSHNNHVGVPYTLCRISREHRWAVVEMGMNHSGEIKTLSELAEPDVAVITVVAPAHIGNFVGIEGVVDAKFEILAGLKPDGAIILNADDPNSISGGKRHLSARKSLYFGSHAGVSALVSEVQSEGLSALTFKLNLLGQECPVRMEVLGRHNAINAACAALAAKTLLPEISLDQVRSGLGAFQAPLMRLNIRRLTGGRTIIDDSYNANPASMRSSLELVRGEISAGRRVGLILGDMLELGAFAEKYHRELAEFAAALKPAFLISVGEYRELLVRVAIDAGLKAFAADSPAAAAQIARKCPFDLLLVKASRGMGLDRTVSVLVESEGEEIPQPVPGKQQ